MCVCCNTYIGMIHNTYTGALVSTNMTKKHHNSHFHNPHYVRGTPHVSCVVATSHGRDLLMVTVTTTNL